MSVRSVQGIAQLTEAIKRADAISFDFFDTLFVRNVMHPEDVFDIIGARFSIADFREIRARAQSEAFRRMQVAGKKEITLAGIYDCMDDFPDLAPELMRAEMETELLVVHPNLELIDVFMEAIELGKRVVLTSDMYLPECFFEQAFQKHALPRIPFYISAECDATKRDRGELFDIVANDIGLPRDRILHVGDNPHGDVAQAEAKGLATFHYLEHRRPPQATQQTIESSISSALLRKHSDEVEGASYMELGYLYGGPAAVGYLDWLKTQTQRDNIDHVLFMSRDGYVLDRILGEANEPGLVKFDYFYGSRVAFTLAAIDDSNFRDYVPFLLSGAGGLSPHDLFERIGVPAPADHVMHNLGVGGVFREKDRRQFEILLYAYRNEILKVCRRNRRALFMYLKQLNVTPRSRVALVDVGWSGTSQEAFVSAVNKLIDIDVHGYYFCLADTSECRDRRARFRMSAMISSQTVAKEMVRQIYDNRVAAEVFFSAPHQSVIGWEVPPGGVVKPIYDARSNNTRALSTVAAAIAEGESLFAEEFMRLRSGMQLPTLPENLAAPLIEFMTGESWRTNRLMSQIRDFDGWAFSSNQEAKLVESIG